jgi:hypothetical protein
VTRVERRDGRRRIAGAENASWRIVLIFKACSSSHDEQMSDRDFQDTNLRGSPRDCRACHRMPRWRCARLGLPGASMPRAGRSTRRGSASSKAHSATGPLKSPSSSPTRTMLPCAGSFMLPCRRLRRHPGDGPAHHLRQRRGLSHGRRTHLGDVASRHCPHGRHPGRCVSRSHGWRLGGLGGALDFDMLHLPSEGRTVGEPGLSDVLQSWTGVRCARRRRCFRASPWIGCASRALLRPPWRHNLRRAPRRDERRSSKTPSGPYCNRACLLSALCDGGI